MLWTIFAILIILWLLGWGFHVAGGLIHLLLVIALVAVAGMLAAHRREPQLIFALSGTQE